MEANPHKPYRRDVGTKSLFQKLAEENQMVNKDTSVDPKKKHSNNQAYNSF